VDVMEIGLDGVDWIDLPRDSNQWRVLCVHGNEPSDSIKCLAVVEQLYNWQFLNACSVPSS
jgi:hypothetical protein